MILLLLYIYTVIVHPPHRIASPIDHINPVFGSAAQSHPLTRLSQPPSSVVRHTAYYIRTVYNIYIYIYMCKFIR